MSDHPVFGSSVASHLFINAAATPPFQGGEFNSFTPSPSPLLCQGGELGFSFSCFQCPGCPAERCGTWQAQRRGIRSSEGFSMKHSAKVMPVAAAVTALFTLACCLPLSLTGAAGIAALSIAVPLLRDWLIGLSLLFLAVGVFQLYRDGGACRKRSRSSIAIFGLAAIIVLGVSLFPQAIAVLLADLFQ